MQRPSNQPVKGCCLLLTSALLLSPECNGITHCILCNHRSAVSCVVQECIRRSRGSRRETYCRRPGRPTAPSPRAPCTPRPGSSSSSDLAASHPPPKRAAVARRNADSSTFASVVTIFSDDRMFRCSVTAVCRLFLSKYLLCGTAVSVSCAGCNRIHTYQPLLGRYTSGSHGFIMPLPNFD
jgi:hypothetical protein